MKKQKPATIANETKSSLPDMSLTIMVFNNAHQTPEWIEQVLSNSVAITRFDCNVYICGHVKDFTSCSFIQERIKIGKCTIGLLDEFIHSTGFVYLLDYTNASTLTSAIAFCFGNRKLFVSDEILCGMADKSSGKQELSWGTKIKYFAYNVLGQMLMPTSQKNFTYSYHYFPTAKFNQIATTHTQTAQSILNRSAYLGQGIQYIPLTAKEVKHQSHNWKQIWAEAFLSRIQWLVKEPLSKITTEHKPWRLAFFIISILSFITLPLLSLQFGMTWDEPRHNEYSKHALSYFTSFGEDSTALSATIPTQEFRYYGEHFNVIAAFLYTYISPLGEYETRHLLNALYGFFAILFAVLLIKDLAGWRAGTVGWVLFLTSPVFLAHSMNNPTDIPFATGFSMSLYYLFKVFRTLPSPKWSHIFFLAIGIAIAVGSRVGGILLYAYTAMFMGIHWLILFKSKGIGKGFSSITKYAKIFLTIVVIGHFLSISLWPFGQQEIFTSWWQAFKQSTEGAYFTYNHELFEGVRMYMANVPWYYLPKFIAINTPLSVLVGIVLGLLLIPFAIRLKMNFLLIALVLFTVIFPIAYAEYKSLYYYNGWRHYLFIYPSIIVLAGLGWEMIARLTHKFSSFAPIALSALPLMWMVQNHPNQTVYFNEVVGGTKGAYGQYELDYYSNSCREAGEWIAENIKNDSLKIGINNKPEAAAYYTNKINPSHQYLWMREYEEQKQRWNYAIITTRTFSSNELLNGSFPPAGTVHTIDVDGVPICAIVKRTHWNMPLGYEAFQRNDFDSALYYFTRATELEPKDEETWRMLGMTYWRKQNPDSAIMMLDKAIELYPENYSAYNEKGIVVLNGKRNPEKALTLFDKAIELKINYSDAYYYASAIYLNQNKFTEAIKYLNDGIKRGGNRVADLHYNLGYAYMNTNSLNKAEESFINAININPNFLMSYRALAQVYDQLGDSNRAQQVMQMYYQKGGQ
jgi:tetratricopeptide (TPR) repeat protein